MEYTVYRLENIVTKKNYIGMTSLNPKKRWQGEYGGKMVDAINNYPFDLCWKKHIEFQTPNKEQALELEAELMKWYDSIENGYNTSSYGSNYYKHSEESKKKSSEAQTGEKAYWYRKHFAEEHKRKLSEAKTGEKHPFYGKHLSEEHRKHISEAKTGENNPWYGKHLSEEHRKKMAEAHGVNGILQYSKTGELLSEYPSTCEASRQTGCNPSNICKCCKGKLKSTGGYLWKYKNGGLN